MPEEHSITGVTGSELLEFRELFVDLEEVTTYYPLKLSSCGAGDIADYSRNHARRFKSRFNFTYSSRQHLVLVLSGLNFTGNS